MVTGEFQRARRPEQREARRQAILDAAAEMLAESKVNDISLRELSKRVGLAKSNVLRYFETREEVFLELLDRAAREWIADLDVRLAGVSDPDDVAAVIAESLAERPLLCELVSVTTSVLERNISTGVALRFKQRTADLDVTLARTIRDRIPGLSEEGALHFVAASIVIVAGLWPFANPTEPVQAAIAELGLEVPHLAFSDMLRETLAVHLTGVLAREQTRAAE
ncbi:MAG TPA: TetR family transcriptional regulator [Kribbellaceae bacterium]|nr:TetR family transcriptional regulator [Kribbellaceae bacterium]